jgi:hypothetical protein
MRNTFLLFAVLAATGGCSISRDRVWVLAGPERPRREFRVWAQESEEGGDLSIDVMEVVLYPAAGTADLREVLVEERLDWSLSEKLLAPPVAVAAIPVALAATPVVTVLLAIENSRHPPWELMPIGVPLAGPFFAVGYLASFAAFPVSLPPFTLPPFGSSRERQRFRPVGPVRPARATVDAGEAGFDVVGARVRVRSASPPDAPWSDWQETDWYGCVEPRIPGLDPVPPGTALLVEVETETGLLRFPVTVHEHFGSHEGRPPRLRPCWERKRE